MTTDIINILMSGIFYASTLFLLAAGVAMLAIAPLYSSL